MHTYLPLRLLAFCILFAVAGFFAVRFPDMPGTSAGSFVSTGLIALPAFAGLARRFGWRRTFGTLGALSLLGFLVELTGVVTGFPYGQFSYSNDLGPKVAGLVPYILPISWVPLVLGAVAATEPQGPSQSLRQALRWMLSAALLLTAVDGVLDPGAAHLGFWVWPGGGVYYGVPLSNYIGWLLSSTLAAGLLIHLLPWDETRPAPVMLDSGLIALAFWTSVVAVTGFAAPALLGVTLFVWLLWRRRTLAVRAREHVGPQAATAESQLRHPATSL